MPNVSIVVAQPDLLSIAEPVQPFPGAFLLETEEPSGHGAVLALLLEDHYR